MYLLQDMLSYKRASDSPSEQAFIARFLDPVPGMRQDGFGNRYLRLGDAPTTLFSAHTDSIHLSSGRQQIRQDRHARVFFMDDGEPLGADDATGCWILLQLIAQRVPGLYLFHRQEESGGRGSEWLAHHASGSLTGIRHAVAFDRCGTTDVITHQRGSRCCSDAFAAALATQLGLNFLPSDEGYFTDTAHYVGLVPECTNLSIGYENAHSGDEYQDYGFLADLLPALLRVDWPHLPVARECDPHPWGEAPSLAAQMAGSDLPALMAIVEAGRFPSRAALIQALGPRLGAALARQEIRHWHPQGQPATRSGADQDPLFGTAGLSVAGVQP